MNLARMSASGLAVAAVTAMATIVVSHPATAAATWTRTSDFNGDGYDDLATGAPGGTVNGKVNAGYVTIVPGSRNGLVAASATVLSQATDEVPGDPADYKWFGETLAAGDVNGDRFADLVVGTPRDFDTETVTRPGSLTVFFGSITGLRSPSRILGTNGLGTAITIADMDGNGQPEVIATEPPSNFGKVVRFTVAQGDTTLVRTRDTGALGTSGLASGDVNGDGYDDVVTLYTQVGGSSSFAMYAGSPTGLSAEPLNDFTYDGGADLTVGDLNRDGYADVVIGRPVGVRYGPEQSGQATVWYGTGQGLGAEPSLTIDQDTAGVPDAKEDYDQFGSAVAIGDLTGDGNPELVIGAQRESLETTDAAGAVTILRGSPTGPAESQAQWFARGAGGLGGVPQTNEQLGWLTTIHDFNGDRFGDVAVTAIGGNASTSYPYYGDGSVTVFPGGVNGADAAQVSVLTPQSVGAPADEAKFGWSLGR